MFALYTTHVLAHTAFVYVDWALLYIIFTDTILHHLILILCIFFMRLLCMWVIFSFLEIIAWVIVITPRLQWARMDTAGICPLLYSHIRLWNYRLLIRWLSLFGWRLLFGDVWVIIRQVWWGLSVLMIEFIFVFQKGVILLDWLFLLRVFLTRE